MSETVSEEIDYIALAAWYANASSTTVGDLIDYLSQFPPDTQIVLNDY